MAALPRASKEVEGSSFLAFSTVPLLATHRGSPPALAVLWHNVGRRSNNVDVVVHFHGFSDRAASMDLVRDMLPV